MSLRVAITRAAPENARTAAYLQQRGASPLLAPLLDIVPRAFDANVHGVQALLFTSSNGVHAFTRESAVRSVPVFAVGDATAQAARALGFAEVRSADGDVAALAALVARTLKPAEGKLVHIGGAHVAGDLGGALKNAGFSVERRIGYEAEAVRSLPLAFREPLDAVLFHSARAAEILADLGPPDTHRLKAVCISAAVADAARKTAWKQVIVASAPREDALVAALGLG
ncbi:MAG TPA: uroporphyrinogen-III synthase [Vitreimonas sp.]|nr:uroporphyrinogen-III synthase [Vitreimonas sp.]